MSALLVFVSVGTDHHRFDRLIRETSAWAERHPGPVRLVVQHGHSATAVNGENHHMLDRESLLSFYRRADVVVTQVGPGTIADVNAVGRRPIVVPRDPRRGEVVDDHQYAYGRLMDERGHVWVAQDRERLHELMSCLAADPSLSSARCVPPDLLAVTTAFAELTEEVMSRPAGRISPRGLLAMLRGVRANPAPAHPARGSEPRRSESRRSESRR